MPATTPIRGWATYPPESELRSPDEVLERSESFKPEFKLASASDGLLVSSHEIMIDQPRCQYRQWQWQCAPWLVRQCGHRTTVLSSTSSFLVLRLGDSKLDSATQAGRARKPPDESS